MAQAVVKQKNGVFRKSSRKKTHPTGLSRSSKVSLPNHRDCVHSQKTIWRDTIVEDKVYRRRQCHEAVGWVVLKVKTKTYQ